jgi:glycerate-2-kinase
MLFKNYNQLVANGDTEEFQKKRRDILDILTAALEAVDPYKAVHRLIDDSTLAFEGETVDLSDFDHIFCVGFGKASIGMVKALYESIPITKGAVITNDPSASLPSANIKVIVGGHPIPNERGIYGAKLIGEIVNQCGPNDIVLVVISGGGSALLCHPRVSLRDLQKTTDLLLRCGASINEINTIRKHVSFVKGGQLVSDVKGVVLSLIISDVVGDPLDFIASGPTSPDSTTFSDAEHVLQNYQLWYQVPHSVQEVITKGKEGKIPETPKHDNPMFDSVFNYVIANNTLACTAAQKKAKELKYSVSLLSTTVTGEARTYGSTLVKQTDHKTNGTHVLLSGGETTVTMKGTGKGGRNQELVLGAVEELSLKKMVLASFATDGIDGKSDAAGAIADGNTLLRAKKAGLSPQPYLDNNNSYAFFSSLGDLLLTGPTGTNVMDLHICMV